MVRLQSTIILAVLIAGLSPGLAQAQTRCVPSPPATAGGDPGVAQRPSYLTAWTAKYPSSTLPARITSLTGNACNVCHNPSGLGDLGNCYREEMVALILGGMSIEQALDQLDAEDSDGDGVPNGEEITTARPEPGEIGYSPGLVGDTGTDPCSTTSSAPVTGMPETPPPADIPAASAWGILVLTLAMAALASLMLRFRVNRSVG